MAELFKFRCPDCAKLLGVPARKAGKVIHCPQCRVELIVPTPDGDPAGDPGEAEEAVDLAGLGIDLGFDSPLAARPAEVPPARPLEEAAAISFLERAVELPPRHPAPAPPADDPGGADAESAAGPPVDPVKPPVPSSRPRRRSGAVVDSTDRRRDVVLPRTAAISWALFAILALGLSFVAGLMIGHYRWR